ncbi:uncharacterized protein LOC144192115 [Stigmatopora nigra]
MTGFPSVISPQMSAETISNATSVAVPPGEVPPPLKPGEAFHVFISYSSTDSEWTHALIERLETAGLCVCYHDRDFTAGRGVLENMSDCIQKSQKVLLVLSWTFVRSRWCLLEANMSMFRDCLERKPLVPVLLEPGVSIPLHLCHLTYLEVGNPGFDSKLLKVLCTPNHELQASTVVPYQPPSIYNGKALQPLTATNVESLYKWDAGQFSDTDVPDQLRLILADPEKYKKAVRMVNDVSSKRVWMPRIRERVFGYIMGVVFFLVLVLGFIFYSAELTVFLIPVREEDSSGKWAIILIAYFSVPIGFLIQLCLWKNDDEKYVVREMQKAAGHANVILVQEKLLMGFRSNSIMYLVYVSLEGCKRHFGATFDDSDNAEELLQIALVRFSSEYACSLAKRHFPFPQPCPPPGHLEGGVCFCQYVSMQLSLGERR